MKTSGASSRRRSAGRSTPNSRSSARSGRPAEGSPPSRLARDRSAEAPRRHDRPPADAPGSPRRGPPSRRWTRPGPGRASDRRAAPCWLPLVRQRWRRPPPAEATGKSRPACLRSSKSFPGFLQRSPPAPNGRRQHCTNRSPAASANISVGFASQDQSRRSLSAWPRAAVLNRTPDTSHIPVRKIVDPITS